MNDPITRRTVLKWVALGAAAGAVESVGCRVVDKSPRKTKRAGPSHSWENTHDRIWLGGQFWANPMEDWQVMDGAAECLSTGGQRSVHSLTHEITNPLDGFILSVEIERVQTGTENGGAGFRIGLRSEIDEYRSNCFVKRGVIAGLIGSDLKLGEESSLISREADPGPIRLQLSGIPTDGKVRLLLEAASVTTGSVLGQVEQVVHAESLRGNVSLVSNYLGSPDERPGKAAAAAGSRYRFRSWTMEGEAFTIRSERRFGPLLWSMYTLSDSRSEEGFVLKMSALTGPMGPRDSQVVELQVRINGRWRSLGTAKLDPDAWVATFRIPNWNETVDTPYKVVYREQHRDGTETPDVWSGIIQANPVGRPVRMVAMTCQNDYAFPYEPLVTNVEQLKPDMLFFSGDQIYESHGGFGIIREPAKPAILNYLRKFYQFGWAFREVMRNAPTVCLPDDHDVLQGNLWGEGGEKMKDLHKDPGASVLAGYAEPARVVNAIHLTNVGHHPDPFDPTPAKQGIGVYYGDLVYGDVGFAIIADRQWKSGPDRVNAVVGGKHANREAEDFDQPGLVLLGERQEEWLKDWAADWRGHALKAVLSQTLFSSLATHQPDPDRFLRFDFDSNSWPQTPRNRAIDILRPSMALHICGDTHLATLSQYGVEAQRDSSWAFCTPAIAVGWPRWWLPDKVGMPHQNRPEHGLANTGEYLDGFGNKAYVYAVGNPEIGKAPNRYEKAHEKGSGFGFITFDTESRTYLVESFRFLIDVTDGAPDNQFPGWPAVIHQEENRGENRLK
jgi:hypothetical protein